MTYVDEVVISEEFIDSLINQIPSELKKKKAAYSIFYEMDCDDVVINKIYPGYMSFYNRFLRYTDIIEKYRDEIKDFYKVEGENIAEIYETFGFNANSYYPIFDDRLEFDLTRNHAIDENYKEVINIYDTNLVCLVFLEKTYLTMIGWIFHFLMLTRRFMVNTQRTL